MLNPDENTKGEIEDNGNDLNGGFAGSSKPETPEGEKPLSGVMSNIASRLSNAEVPKAEHSEEVIEKEAPAFDLTKLTSEDLARLKQMLNATPDRLMKKKGNPIVTMRKLNGKFIVKFKKTFQTMVMDEELQKKVAVLMIPVLFYGDTEYTDIRWDNFHDNAERVKCEVINILSKTEEILDGTTISRDTGAEVEMYKTMVRSFMTVVLPETGTVEIEAGFVNA